MSHLFFPELILSFYCHFGYIFMIAFTTAWHIELIV